MAASLHGASRPTGECGVPSLRCRQRCDNVARCRSAIAASPREDRATTSGRTDKEKPDWTGTLWESQNISFSSQMEGMLLASEFHDIPQRLEYLMQNAFVLQVMH